LNHSRGGSQVKKRAGGGVYVPWGSFSKGQIKKSGVVVSTGLAGAVGVLGEEKGGVLRKNWGKQGSKWRDVYVIRCSEREKNTLGFESALTRGDRG